MTTIEVGSTPQPAPGPRCCPSHPDWPTLVHHLAAEFAEVRLALVIREVQEAREVVMSVGILNDEALEVAEIIARHRLRIATGAVDDMARLDPQPRHSR